MMFFSELFVPPRLSGGDVVGRLREEESKPWDLVTGLPILFKLWPMLLGDLIGASSEVRLVMLTKRVRGKVVAFSLG